MIEVFKNKQAQCTICGSPTDGRYQRGDKYYCASHYESTSPQELIENQKVERDYRNNKIKDGTHS